MENSAIFTVNIEVHNGIAHFSIWTPTDRLPKNFDIKKGGTEGTRPLLDVLGKIMGLELSAKKK